MRKQLLLACEASLRGHERKFQIGAIGIRRDGTIVRAWNSGVGGQANKSLHAEARLVRKLDHGSIVYVARTMKSDGSVAMAKPCVCCENALRHRGVIRVYYTISANEHGCVEL